MKVTPRAEEDYVFCAVVFLTVGTLFCTGIVFWKENSLSVQYSRN